MNVLVGSLGLGSGNGAKKRPRAHLTLFDELDPLNEAVHISGAACTI